jgi:hypothetical protein
LLHARYLDGQTLTAFGAARVDYSAATAGFHANQKTMGTGAANLGGLVSAFHLDFLTGSFGEAASSISLNALGAARKSRREFCCIAQALARGTHDYGKFSKRQQDLRSDSACDTVRWAAHTEGVDKVLINYNPARSNP